jgi:hypothetical protein
VHFKDFASYEAGMDPVELGKGVAPLAEVAKWMRESLADTWVIAEQDSSKIPPADAARENAAYLRSLFS